MLMSDYHTYSQKDSLSGGGSHCRLCPTTSYQSTLPEEDIEHVLTQCVGTSDTRRAKLPALLSLAATAKSTVNIEKISSNNSILTQFLLDCTSCNLDNDTRISAIRTGDVAPIPTFHGLLIFTY